MKKNTIFLIVLFLVLVIGSVGFWFYRDRIFSKEVLRVEILGPENAKAGDEIEYTVKYKNNGNFVLEKPKLSFELPEYSLTEDEKTRFTQDIKDIYPGEENIIKFKGVLLGKENDIKTARARISYIPKNLSARYESETTFTTKIEAVSLSLNFDMPSKVEKSKEFAYSLNYFSNIDYPLENLSVKIEQAQGFDIKSSDPVSLDNLEWKISTLNKSQGGRINIRGSILSGQESQIVFLAKLGMWQNGNFIVIKEVQREIQVIQPLIFISQQINGFSDYVASPGENLRYEIFIRNVGSSPFDGLFIISRLDGPAFDLSVLKSPEGQTRANDNMIIFDYKQIPKLQFLNPKEEVKIEFSVKLKDGWTFSDADKNNMFIKNRVDVLNVSEEFTTKISSKLELSQKVYYSNQAGIENSGPIPPQSGAATTYIINWQIINYFNDVKNVKVKAVLSQGITLNDVIVPESQAPNFSFDSASREIVWLAGDISAAAGIASSPPSLYFQISLTPSIFQKGRTAEIIGQAIVSGEDQFMGTSIQGFAPAVDTNLPDDANNSGKGIVQ